MINETRFGSGRLRFPPFPVHSAGGISHRVEPLLRPTHGIAELRPAKRAHASGPDPEARQYICATTNGLSEISAVDPSIIRRRPAGAEPP